jgi:hypothetical protein
MNDHTQHTQIYHKYPTQINTQLLKIDTFLNKCKEYDTRIIQFASFFSVYPSMLHFFRQIF